MTLYNILALLLTLTGIAITCYRHVYTRRTSSRTELREQAKFAREFYDAKRTGRLNSLTIELSYCAMAGDKTIPGDIIQHLLSFDNRLKAFDEYRFAKTLLQFTDNRFSYVDSLQKGVSPRVRRYFWFCLWIILFLCASAPLVFAPKLQAVFNVQSLQEYLPFAILFIFVFGWAAYVALRKLVALGTAKSLLLKQEELEITQDKISAIMRESRGRLTHRRLKKLKVE